MPRRAARRNPMRKRRMPKRSRFGNKKLRRQVHVFKRTAFLGTSTASISAAGIATPIATAHTFSLAQLPGVTEFSNLFDQYKITGARLTYTPAASEGILTPQASAAAPLGYSRVHSVIDYDDSTAPPSEDALLEYGSHKSTAPFQTHSRYLKPKILQEVYRSAISTSYAPRGNTYLDMAATDVPHYGVKVWVSAPNTFFGTAQTIAYKVYVTLYFTCKNTR